MTQQKLDELVVAAMRRISEWVNRSAGQHKRAMEWSA